jgi:hypothetical protein
VVEILKLVQVVFGCATVSIEDIFTQNITIEILMVYLQTYGV